MFLPGKRLRLLLPMVLCFNVLFSQEISPYSRFALGDAVSSSFAASKGMGRLTAGYRDPLHINFNNPASYSNLALTTLETGFKFSTKKIRLPMDKQSRLTEPGMGFSIIWLLGSPLAARRGSALV
jgi:hypothetical protein